MTSLHDALGSIPGTLIFKLAHASGGLGTVVVDADSTAESLFARTAQNYDLSTGFVVEQYVEGTEHSAAGLVVNGEPMVYAIADKMLAEGSLITNTTIVPSRLPAPRVDELVRAAEGAVRAVGIHTGGFHVDMRMTADGPLVLEVGARLGGDLINSHLVPLASSGAFRPYQVLIDLLAAGVLPAPPRLDRASAMFLVQAADDDVDQLVRRASGHPQVRAASRWTQYSFPCIAVVVDGESPHDMGCIIDDVKEFLAANGT